MDDLYTTLTEQRRELMAAKTLDSDLDLAYQLQMQEAMNASLALHNPATASSSRTPPHPKPNDDDDVVFIPQSPNGDVLDIATTLMLEDMNRFVQELEDREQSEAETRKLKEDLDRRIHDQKLAVDIHNIPDQQWEKYGDNYHRPYRTPSSSSSSSKALVDSECFRLYFKGLVSEERVRGIVVNVAGAGVGICDSRDNLILESRKNLEALVNGAVVSSEVAELQALIEALNKALNLDLKSVTFFCDDYMLYQYVTGRVPPRQSKIVTLVNQVALLQRKFTYCNPSLVARNNIKFAFKSARDAIVSQIIWAEETSKGKLKETCVICFEDTDVDNIFSVDGCLHRYCFSCMKQHVEVKLLNGMVAKCPHENCKSEVSIDSCGKFLAPNLVEVMSQRIKESSISPTEKVYCPYPRSNPNAHPGDAKLKSLAKSNRWRQCLKCNHMVELAEDVDMSFATLVEPSGRTRKQHVPVKSGMSVTLYMITGKDDDW
nr:putative e3 ubiquitin-protein ligase rbra [Quercus suber]